MSTFLYTAPCAVRPGGDVLAADAAADRSEGVPPGSGTPDEGG